MTNNDERILILKDSIRRKKEELGKRPKHEQITNYMLEFDGEVVNIHAISPSRALHLLVKLNSLYLSAKDLGVEEDYKICGHKIEDWILDLKARLESRKYHEKQKALNSLEKELEDMLSNEKKVEMKLDDIQSLLDS